MTASKQAAAIERAMYMLETVVKFIEENSECDYLTVDYDDTTCDGKCLQEDCRVAAEELGRTR